MEMTFRWYGSKFDTVTLEQIRQIPGVTGVITTLYDTTPGEVWTREAIHALKEEVEASGLHISGIESVNIHDAIKIGSPDREQYIDNYIETLKHLGEEDIHLVCYNFMPVFDWTRTELARVRPDGSTVLAYKQSAVDALVPEKMFESIAGDANGAILPGWEPERMAKVKSSLTLTAMWMMRNCLPTSNTSSNASCRSATSTTLEWPFTRTTRHGVSSVFRESSLIKKTFCA